MDEKVNKVIRKILLFISTYILKDYICEILYPDNCVITFGNGHKEDDIND